MLTVAAIAAGLGVLLLVGAYQLSTARLAGPDAKRTQLFSEQSATFTRGDFKDPGRILSDGAKLRNGLVVVLEVAAIVMAVWMTVYVYGAGFISTGFKLLITASLVVGALLVGRGLYVRLGLYGPVTVQESLRTELGTNAADDYQAIRGALASARGDEGIVDDATAGLLAAAKNEQTMDAVTEWGHSEDVADPETFERRVERLDEAGIVQREDGQLSVEPRLADADGDQLASVAVTVLD